MPEDSQSHLIIISLLTLITVNLFLLDLKVFSASSVKLSDISTVATPPPSNPTVNPENSSCPASCVSLINNVSAPAGSGVPVTRTEANNIPRETYIPLGTGSTQKADWDDIISTETLIDPANYGKSLQVSFIAALRNPTQNGQVMAQLYNVTDGHIVWNSQVTLNGPVSQTLTSGPVTLDPGAKLYRVQLKSTLSYEVFLDNAKIRIVSE